MRIKSESKIQILISATSYYVGVYVCVRGCPSPICLLFGEFCISKDNKRKIKDFLNRTHSKSNNFKKVSKIGLH